MSKRPRSDYETGDDATRAGLDPKPDGGGLLAEYIPCRTFQGSRPGYYFKLDAKGPGYYLDKRARPFLHCWCKQRSFVSGTMKHGCLQLISQAVILGTICMVIRLRCPG